MINYEAPTEKQIKFAESIANALDLDFPTCSQDYTKAVYQAFIAEYYNAYREMCDTDPTYDDVEMVWWDPFAEGGY